MRFLILVFLILFVPVLTGCTPTEEDSLPSANSGSDADADVDEGQELDTDTGTDSDDNGGKEQTTDAGVNSDADTDTDIDTDADSDSDIDADGDVDSDGDSDGDADTPDDTDTGSETSIDSDAGVDTDEIVLDPDCSGCLGVGKTLPNLLCALDLCEQAGFVSQTYTSSTVEKKSNLKLSYAAVERFGDPSNALAPLFGGSYAMMATGVADSTDHNTILGQSSLYSVNGASDDDVFGGDPAQIFDVVEWKVHLKAPAEAIGFAVSYVFLSVEYDEYIGDEYNDKFYMVLEADSTNDGEATIINASGCRDPDSHVDFVCSKEQAQFGLCEKGDDTCYVTINSALSECCWYDGCDNGQEYSGFNIDGTGFECGTAQSDGKAQSEGHKHGSSTAWLVTEWPIEPGEEFSITFHLHDTVDALLDSQVILDQFKFVEQIEQGTRKRIQ
jgi:hypothetical protein